MYDAQKAYEAYVGGGVWHFGMAPEAVSDFLAPYGWPVREHLGYIELAARFVTPTGRQLATTPFERMVYAEKQ